MQQLIDHGSAVYAQASRRRRGFVSLQASGVSHYDEAREKLEAYSNLILSLFCTIGGCVAGLEGELWF